jgi:hypothetical protein
VIGKIRLVGLKANPPYRLAALLDHLCHRCYTANKREDTLSYEGNMEA